MASFKINFKPIFYHYLVVSNIGVTAGSAGSGKTGFNGLIIYVGEYFTL